MIEGSGLLDPGSGSRRPKNTWIRWIRIRWIRSRNIASFILQQCQFVNPLSISQAASAEHGVREEVFHVQQRADGPPLSAGER
jgi:hypothetical protein